MHLPRLYWIHENLPVLKKSARPAFSFIRLIYDRYQFAAPPQSDQLSDKSEIDNLREMHYELREKLLSMRENELLSLRQEVRDLSLKFNLAVIVGTVLIAGASIFGFSQLADLDALINKSMQKRVDDSLGYYDQVSKALLLSNNSNCRAALNSLEELATKRPDDEVVFSHLTHCWLQNGEFNKVLGHVKNLKEKNLFAKTVATSSNLYNVGFAYLVKSFFDKSFEREARDLLNKSLSLAIAEDNSEEQKYPMHNLIILNLYLEKPREAAVYAHRLRELGDVENWASNPDEPWLKILESKKPSVIIELKKLSAETMPPATN